ncbi:MAG: hypothetical protein ACFCUQ_05590 [Kiloniellales bacterium]
MSDKPRPAAADARALPQGHAPLRKGNRVIVRLRANREFEGRVHAVSDGAVRILDPAVRDILRLHAEDIALIRKSKDAQ